ncbi:hypothetical protein RHGRI_033133 [Rhododendron griersonianum]|uniref:F-box associated beta-propeller type 1 domain-containing protein n=1 Tax=Rhododendron griersonianum TaxID=479676 RepID=A0AAV6HYW3_9ERIC|nr:hypothetical protein RHGRI_033133 [Rhododendron griersonianum]
MASLPSSAPASCGKVGFRWGLIQRSNRWLQRFRRPASSHGCGFEVDLWVLGRGFEVDLCANGYKLIRIVFYFRPTKGGDSSCKANLYVVSTNTWTEIDDKKLSLFTQNDCMRMSESSASMVLNGVFYWQAHEVGTSRVILVSFDMGDELSSVASSFEFIVSLEMASFTQASPCDAKSGEAFFRPNCAEQFHTIEKCVGHKQEGLDHTLRLAEHVAAEIALNTLANRGPSKALASKVLVVKLKAFSKFENTSEALSAATLLIDSKPSKGLRKFLRAHCDGETLVVADSKLRNAIKEKLQIECVHNNTVMDGTDERGKKPTDGTHSWPRFSGFGSNELGFISQPISI